MNWQTIAIEAIGWISTATFLSRILLLPNQHQAIANS